MYFQSVLCNKHHFLKHVKHFPIYKITLHTIIYIRFLTYKLILPVISSAIARDAVAAGEGAFTTLIIF